MLNDLVIFLFREKATIFYRKYQVKDLEKVDFFKVFFHGETS